MDDGEVVSLGANLIVRKVSPMEAQRLVERGQEMERRQCCSKP